MSESITVRFTLPVSAREVYDAWLDGQQHSAMTGAKATASRSVDGEFTAWDGYIHGKNLLLIENQKIVQSWRSSEFPDEASDSVLSIRLTERHGLTEVELEHTDIPPGNRCSTSRVGSNSMRTRCRNILLPQRVKRRQGQKKRARSQSRSR